MFLHPSQFDRFVKEHIVITEEDYTVLSKSIEDGFFGDVEKARKDLSGLTKVQTPVLRDGKVFIQTFYINPKKTDPETLKQKYRKGSEDVNHYKPAEPTNVQFDSNILKRGDLVKIKLQDGTETIGQFRHFAVSKEDGSKKVIIRAEIKTRQGQMVTKTIERKTSDVVVMEKPKEGVIPIEIKREFDPNSFEVGNGVSITLRVKKEDGKKGVDMPEVEGVLVKKTTYGFFVLLPDGTTVERPVSTLRKTSDKKSPIDSQQEIILNKAIKRIKTAIQDKVNLIDVLQRKKPSGWENTVSRITSEMESDKNMQRNYYEVFKGNLPFENIVKEAPEKAKTPYSER